MDKYLNDLRLEAKEFVNDVLAEFEDSRASQVYSTPIISKALVAEIKKILNRTDKVEYQVVSNDDELDLIITWTNKKKVIVDGEIIYVDFKARRVTGREAA